MRLALRQSDSGKRSVLNAASLNATSTLQDLHAAIATELGVSSDDMQLKAGYPPKDLSSLPGVLSELGVKDGDQILVTLKTVTGTISTAQETTKPLASSSTSPSALPTRPEIVKLKSGGYLVVREMKDDNSCLFRSIAYVLEKNAERYLKLRRIIADQIQARPNEFPEVVLGRAPDAYCSWIQTPGAWGGAIELSIFSEYFQAEIDSIDIATCRVDRFGEGKFKNRVLILYSGIHYDALAVTSSESASQDMDMTNFPVNPESDELIQAGLQLAEQMRKARKFTDMGRLTLRCGVCQTGLKGEKEAQAHAMSTGHASFTEY